MNLDELIQRFLDDRAAYCADRTVEFYTVNLGKFREYLASGGIDLVEDLDYETAQRYQTHIRKYIGRTGRKIKNTSVNTYMRAVRTFLRWLTDEGYLKQTVKLPKKVRDDSDQIIPLTASEVEVLDNLILRDYYFRESPALWSYYTRRNWLLLHSMLDEGLRVAEVAALRWSQVDFDKGLLLVYKGKGRKDRIVPLSAVYGEQLRYYRDEILAPGHRHPESYVFYDRFEGEPITVNAIKLYMSKKKRQSGIDRLHCHLLRHTFATSFIMGGGDVSVLRVLLGHEDFVITQRYLHLAAQFTIAKTDIYKLDSVYRDRFTLKPVIKDI